MTRFTPFQLHLAQSANAASNAGFSGLACAMAEVLRREIQVEDIRGRRIVRVGFYGRFKLNEGDEHALETVESPRGCQRTSKSCIHFL